MRIDRIDIIRVQNPFAHPFETSFTRFETRDALLVKVYSEGLIGYGECKAFYGPFYNPEDNGTCFHVIKNMIAPRILHQDIESPGIYEEHVVYYRQSSGEGGGGKRAVGNFAAAGKQIAENLAGRHAGRGKSWR